MDTNTPKCDDYEVGYKKPPKATQFKKGQSGNSRGRPPRAKDNTELFNKILDEKVSITDNGRLRKLTKRQIAFKQLANRAVKGDYKAIETMLQNFSALRTTRDDEGKSPAGNSEGGTVIRAWYDVQPGDDDPELATLLFE